MGELQAQDSPSFTSGSVPEAEARVARDVDHIVTPLKQREDVEAIWLVGGFGRGEGVCRKQGGNYVPQNDYDLELLVNGRVLVGELEELGKQMAEEIRIDWVDLHAHGRKDLVRIARATQYGRDFANGARLLYERGAPGQAEEFRASLANPMEPLPFVEAEKIFLARIWALFAASSTELSRQFRLRQLAKTCLALVDAKLIAEDLYRTSYREKREQWRPLVGSDDELLWTEWAFGEKLEPELSDGRADSGLVSSALEPETLVELASFYSSEFLELASKAYGSPIKRAADYAEQFGGLERKDLVGQIVTRLRPRRTRGRKQDLMDRVALLESFDPASRAWCAERDSILESLPLPRSARKQVDG